jgi:hypothetical protein
MPTTYQHQLKRHLPERSTEHQMDPLLTSRCSTVLTANCISISAALPADSPSNDMVSILQLDVVRVAIEMSMGDKKSETVE